MIPMRQCTSHCFIANLKTDSDIGFDGISSKFLEKYKHIFVCLLQSGIFHDSLKKAEVCPIYKGVERNRINDYRPISILPCLSKILEGIVNVRLTKYLDMRNFLSVFFFLAQLGKLTEWRLPPRVCITWVEDSVWLLLSKTPPAPSIAPGARYDRQLTRYRPPPVCWAQLNLF